MTIAATARKTIALGNGATTDFGFAFAVVSEATLAVTYTDPDEVATLLAPGTYKVALDAPAAGQLWSAGGTVTYPWSADPLAALGGPIPTGSTLTVARALPLVQGTQVSSQSALYLQVIEQALDYLTMVDQQAAEAQARSLAYPIGDPAASALVPAADARRGKALAFDSVSAAPTAIDIAAYFNAAIAAADIAGFGTVINPLASVFGAKGDGVVDDWAALNAAIDAAIAAKGTLLLPTLFAIGQPIQRTGSFNLVGCGGGSGLHLLAASGTILKIDAAAGIVLRDFTLLGSAVARLAGFGLQTHGCARLRIENLAVDSVSASGQWHEGLVDSDIVGCDVRNSFADGFDVTAGSRNVVVRGCTAYDTGDDGFAALSFIADGARCERIRFIGCSSENSKARNFANIGSVDVKFEACHGKASAGSGFIVAEDAAFGSTVPDWTELVGCTSDLAGTYATPTGSRRGFEIHTSALHTKLAACVAKSGATRGFDVLSADISLVGCTAIGNATNGFEIHNFVKGEVSACRAETNGQYGFFVQTTTNGAFLGNTAIDNNTSSTAGVDNFNFTTCNDAAIVGNISRDTRGGGAKIDRGIEVLTSANVTFYGNIDTGSVSASPHIATGCTDVKQDLVVASADPAADARYVAGQHWFNTANDKLWVQVTPGTWKSVTLT